MADVTHGSAGVAPRPVVIPVEESSQVGEARRAAVALADSIGFDETDRGRVALVATEAATNLVKHAREGVLIAQAPRVARDREIPMLEILAVDRGAGMADATRAMRDGYSTAGTAGKGLGAIERAADRFEIDSYPGRGTVLHARLYASGHAPDDDAAFDVGSVCVPLRGETVCGDAWAIVEHDGRAAVIVADGLGHGPDAATAAELASRTLVAAARGGNVPAPGDVLTRAHGALRATRGAAVAVAVIDPASGMRFAGIGNVAASLFADGNPADSRSLVSLNGIVGHQMRTPNELAYPWRAGALLVLATDGVRTQWRLDTYPGLARRHPSIIAATLWRDHGRGRDDATVVVLRQASPRPEAA